MARTIASLPAGTRITDYISLGLIARSFPAEKVREILHETGRASVRQRDLPAHVVVYYIIALPLYMRSSCREVLRCLLEGVQWLSDPRATVKVASKSGISQARIRLGLEPLKQLYDSVVQPIAARESKGAWYRQWRLSMLMGEEFDTADTVENHKFFGGPEAGADGSAPPRLRFVALLESGSAVLWGARVSPYTAGKLELAHEVVPALRSGILCMADESFLSCELWRRAAQTGADLLWQIQADLQLDVDECLSDGSYLSRIYPSGPGREQTSEGTTVRVVDYRLKQEMGSVGTGRLITTILDPARAPAQELAALYEQRREIGTALDELRTHLPGTHIVLRSKTPELVQQEFYGLLLAHFAIRRLMHDAALGADGSPEGHSVREAVRVVDRRMSRAGEAAIAKEHTSGALAASSE